VLLQAHGCIVITIVLSQLLPGPVLLQVHRLLPPPLPMFQRYPAKPGHCLQEGVQASLQHYPLQWTPQALQLLLQLHPVLQSPDTACRKVCKHHCSFDACSGCCKRCCCCSSLSCKQCCCSSLSCKLLLLLQPVLQAAAPATAAAAAAGVVCSCSASSYHH
jgi:hypothetical protein